MTFRNCTAERVILLARESGVERIEWGGDIHVPPGDLENARRVARLTRAAGMDCVSYGSYYQCDDTRNFIAVSETAEALEAKTIRVWAGKKDYEGLTETEKQTFFENVATCAEIARKKGQTIAFEFHHHTFCNRADHVLEALESIAKENVKTYWQPDYWTSFSDDYMRIRQNLNAITTLKDRIENFHFYRMDGYRRLPVSGSEEEWKLYLNELPLTATCFLEFVKDDSEQQFREDMKVLERLL